MPTSSKPKLRQEIHEYPGGAFPLTAGHFELERMAFGHIRQCPGTYEDFQKEYLGMRFVVCSMLEGSSLVAFKLLNVVAEDHYHSFITVVRPGNRKQGLARAMSEALCSYLSDRGPFLLTKFSVPSTWEVEFESKRLELVSTSGNLEPIEDVLLGNLICSWASERIKKSRIQKGYYEHADGTHGDALFKAYRLKEGA